MSDSVRTQKENLLIARRRAAWSERAPAADAPHTGLALSGGGIRSATFSLGLLQALAEHKRLPHLDYLSTVSGGGYAGSFLSSLFLPRYTDLTVPYPDQLPPDQLPPNQPPGDPRSPAASCETPREAAERVERILADPPDTTRTTVNVRGQTTTIFHPVRWLRENGRYLTPSGTNDLMFLATYYLRSLIGVQAVLGVALFGIALLFYTLRLLLDEFVPLPQFWALGWAVTLREGGVLWWSPILWLSPVVLVTTSVPLVLTYWTLYQRHRRGRTPEDWAFELGPTLLGVTALALAWYTEQRSPENPIKYFLLYAGFTLAISLLIRNVYFSLQLGSGWNLQAPLVARARQKLTRGLMTSFYVAVALAGIGLIDSLGQSAFIGLIRGELGAWGSGGAGVVALVMAVRRAADWLAGDASSKLMQIITRNYKLVALGVAMLAILGLATMHAAVVQTVCWSNRIVEWHAQAANNWDAVAPTRATVPLHNELLAWTWLVWLMVAVLIGLSVGFLNNSTFHRFYAARLTRTYLGATNFARLKLFWEKLNAASASAAPAPQTAQRPYGSTVVESHRDDDLAMRSYYELESAGPLHLINVTLNESVSKTSNLQREDRKGIAMSIGPAGIGVNSTFRSWAAGTNQAGNVLAPMAPETDTQLSTVERLPLGAWIAISGAAVSTGLGHMSAMGISLLTWIANVRLAYWWKPAPVMRTVAPEVASRDAHPMRPANTYGLMWQEMRGKFNGQACRHWNLSDGGHFENTGAYELIRRHVPLIFVSDNGADAGYTFNDVQNLVRRVRIDFGTEICFLTSTELDNLVNLAAPEHAPLRALLATPEDFKPSPRMTSKCVLLARATRADGAGSLLVFIKPALTCFAPLDVRAYGDTHHDFPQQATADQFFDEAQWESYRKLGLEIGRAVFAHWDALAGAAASKCR